MKNDDRPVEAIECKLSGVVRAPSVQPNSDALQKWIISSFRETRFQNVLKRTLAEVGERNGISPSPLTFNLSPISCKSYFCKMSIAAGSKS
ncbi:hypothetical protein CDG77_30945 [Nostoc sp. 'Peltigera membranacea cyanobiont' 213]|uniref:hypothetical protein n=1 Tax=Nostoc sp. 'Peltigera membranacea cyanobiont' 213 TaxID=2014530 RepID=UPI000B95B07B|nr:hypothetical protein [Nostoc sp. 'Peltigera membranacea cyanobiont' 213]OYD87162.1 hypothetical protein CDG77_30945 [Nostoc sp. 'Peltigera membranacea cyanobiont' 213]